MDALKGIGHACGHNLIGIAGMFAGLLGAEIPRLTQSKVLPYLWVCMRQWKSTI
jgi:metal-dependent amidase/aminoacylase/carboxypeptidase family protein